MAVCQQFALFCPMFPRMGGVERFTDSLTAGLVRQGHEVIVVTNETHGLGTHDVSSGIETFRLRCFNMLGGRYPVPVRNADYRAVMDELDARQIDGVLVNTRFYLLSFWAFASPSAMASSRCARSWFSVLDAWRSYDGLGDRHAMRM